VNFCNRMIVTTLCLALFNLGSPRVAQATMISTMQAVESNTRAQDLATVNAALSRAKVREQFIALGVDPAQVEARVASLTDSEIHMLSSQVDQVAAGSSVLAVIGVVFIVLMILEAVGVIDIFKKFP
jgi:hypothetical protein